MSPRPADKEGAVPTLRILSFLDKNLKSFSPFVRNIIALALLIVFVVLSLHAFGPTYVNGRLSIKASKNGPLRYANDYELSTLDNEIIPVGKYGRWILPIRGFLPTKIKLKVHNPNRPGIEFAAFELWAPIPILSAITVSEPEVIIHTYREKNRVVISQVPTVSHISESLYRLASLERSAEATSYPQQRLTMVVHLQDIGDVLCEGSDWCGTLGENRRMEGFALMETGIANVGVEYMGHIAETGDTPWWSQRVYCGTRGKGLRLEGVAFRLVGSDAAAYSIKYQVHLKNLGTSQVSENGQFAGTRGEARPIEALRVWIERR